MTRYEPTVGDVIRRARRERKVYAKDLAAKVGVRPETLSAWENGDVPESVVIYLRLARELKDPRLLDLDFLPECCMAG